MATVFKYKRAKWAKIWEAVSQNDVHIQGITNKLGLVLLEAIWDLEKLTHNSGQHNLRRIPSLAYLHG
jgi:hypothetical protein